jgi:SAM-dependent methyltransferase
MQDRAIYVQYGCGFAPGPEGWTNFDASPTLRMERIPNVGPAISALFSGNSKRFPESIRYGDICKGLPVADSSVRGCFASHVLEHLSRDDVPVALSNTFRILEPGGLFRLIVPDLYERAKKYVAAVEMKSSDASAEFLKSSCLGLEKRPRTPFDYLRNAIGGSAHLWMWDEFSMTAALQRAGFVDIRRCEFGDSPDPMFAIVEQKSRYFDDNRQVAECALEARKPG